MSSQPHPESPVNAPLREPGLYFRTALLPDGWAEGVRIQTAGGRISVVESGVAPLAGDERAGIGLPGVPNVHSHAFQRGMAGLTERRHSSGSPARSAAAITNGAALGGAAGDTAASSSRPAVASESDSFWSWRDVMYRFVGRLEPDDLEAIAALAFIEMLEAGFTRVCEFHYVHHDVSGKPYANLAEMGARVAAAAASSGIALTLLPVFYAHGGFGGIGVGPRQARFANDVEQFGRLVEASRNVVAGLADAVVGIAPHSLRAVTPDELRAILPLASGGPVHIHVAEQVREVEECVAQLGARPVQWLTAEMPVNAQWCLVHATHVTDDEVVALARSRAVAGLCPITEANLGDGVFPAAKFQSAGGACAIGSDSNVLISVSEELRLLEYGQRLRDGVRNVLAREAGASTGRTLFEAVVAGGAQAAGVSSVAQAAGGGVSGLTVGASADIVSLSDDDVALAARTGDAILDSFVFASQRGVIDGVWRAGRKVVSGGAHVNRAPVAARFRATLQRLLAP
jgi:formimidoylglutamate deiminase